MSIEQLVWSPGRGSSQNKFTEGLCSTNTRSDLRNSFFEVKIAFETLQGGTLRICESFLIQDLFCLFSNLLHFYLF